MTVPRRVVGRDPWEPRPAVESAPAPEAEPAPASEPVPEPAAWPRRSADLSDAEFEELVEQALEAIPAELAEGVENCAFIVEKEPPAGSPGLLGLYRGHPLTHREHYSGALPDTITIYQGPLTRHYPNPETLAHEVYRTVVHEVGHYFGFEEDELHELGWG